MAFPRVNVVPATPARVAWYAVALVAERRADVRSIVEFMMCVCGGGCTIGVGLWMAAVKLSQRFRHFVCPNSRRWAKLRQVPAPSKGSKVHDVKLVYVIII